MKWRTGGVRIALVVGTVIGVGCNGQPTSEGDTLIVVAAAGDRQTGEAGEPLGTPITVRVRDAAYEPVPGAKVSFSVSSGGGTVAKAVVVTNDQGVAATTWILGVTSGMQGVDATIESPRAPVVKFVATATPARLRITKVMGDSQTVMVRGALPTPFTVEVRDIAGKPVPNIEIGWSVTQTPLPGSGQLTSALTRTDATGRATVGYSLPYRAGSSTVTATVMEPNGREVRFSTTVIPAPPARIEVASLATTIYPGTSVMDSVRVIDTFDEPAVNVTVRWTVYDAGGGSTVTDTPTNELGIARNTRTAWNAVANQVLRTEASVAQPGVQPALLFRTVAAVPTIRMLSGDNQVGVVGQTLPLPMVVLVSDSLGNPMSGVTVTWTPIEFFGNAAQVTTSTTDATGTASYTYLYANYDYYYVVAQIPEVNNLYVLFQLWPSGP